MAAKIVVYTIFHFVDYYLVPAPPATRANA
jgi:hypothetical protein